MLYRHVCPKWPADILQEIVKSADWSPEMMGEWSLRIGGTKEGTGDPWNH